MSGHIFFLVITLLREVFCLLYPLLTRLARSRPLFLHFYSYMFRDSVIRIEFSKFLFKFRTTSVRDSPPAKGSVLIRHPGYDKNNYLIELTAVDYHQHGIHFGIAHISCGIITGNRWDGYFTKTKDGPRLNFGNDEGLPVGDYYHLPPPSLSDGEKGLSFSMVAACMFSPNLCLDVDQELSNTRSFPALHTGSSRIEIFRSPGRNSPNWRLALRSRLPPVDSPNMPRPPK